MKWTCCQAREENLNLMQTTATHYYTETNGSNGFGDHHHDRDSIIPRGITPLLFSLLFLGILFWLLNKTVKQSKKLQDETLEIARANTDAVKENNQLLQESIKLQQETNTLLNQLISRDIKDSNNDPN